MRDDSTAIWWTMTHVDTCYMSEIHGLPPVDVCRNYLGTSSCSGRNVALKEIEDRRWGAGLSLPTVSPSHLGPLSPRSSMISSSWPIMKSNWLWLSSIINEPDGSQPLQAIWQMASSIYYRTCPSGSFSKWFMLWNLVAKRLCTSGDLWVSTFSTTLSSSDYRRGIGKFCCLSSFSLLYHKASKTTATQIYVFTANETIHW